MKRVGGWRFLDSEGVKLGLDNTTFNFDYLNLDFTTIDHAAINAPQSALSPIDRALYSKQIETIDQWKALVLDAPPGYGKTTTMIEWMRRAQKKGDCTTSWLSITNRIGSRPSAFWSHLIVSLDTLWPGLKDDISARGIATSEGMFLALNMATAHVEASFGEEDPIRYRTLFVDFDFLDANGGYAAILLSLINTFPASFRVVISGTRFTKKDRYLFFEDYINQIDMRTLAFNRDEANNLLAKSLDVLPDSAISDELYQKTLGWPRGIQTALSKYRRTSAVYSLIDFDDEDVLDTLFGLFVEQNLTDDELEFCIITSFLDSLDPPLCRVILPNCDPDRMIRVLKEKNAYVVRLDNQLQYGFHPLFLKWLRLKLLSRGATLLKNIGWACADWYRDEQNFEGEVRSLVLAHDLVGYCRYLFNLESTLKETFLRIASKRDAPIDKAILYSIAATCFMYYGRAREARRCIVLAQQSLSEEDNVLDIKSNIEEGLITVDLRVKFLEGNRNEIVESCLATLESDSVEECIEAKCMLLHTIAQAKAFSGDLNSSIDYYIRSKAFANERLALPLKSHCDYEIALLFMEKGELTSALDTCRDALTICSEVEPLYGALHGLMARVCTYRMDFEEAQRLLDIAKLTISPNRSPEIYLEVMYARSLLYYYEEKYAQALELCISCLDILQKQPLARNPMLKVINVYIDSLCAIGEVDEVDLIAHNSMTVANSHNSPLSRLHAQLALVKSACVRGEYLEAQVSLSGLLEAAGKSGYQLLFVLAKSLEPFIWKQLGNRARFSSSMRELLSIAARTGIVAPLLSEIHMGRITQRDLASQAPSSKRDASFLDWLRNVETQRGKPLLKAVDARKTIPRGELTPRENEVAELLIRGMSRKEISKALSISVNTVKVHITSIYAKLGVSDREALLGFDSSNTPKNTV